MGSAASVDAVEPTFSVVELRQQLDSLPDDGKGNVTARQLLGLFPSLDKSAIESIVGVDALRLPTTSYKHSTPTTAPHKHGGLVRGKSSPHSALAIKSAVQAGDWDKVVGGPEPRPCISRLSPTPPLYPTRLRPISLMRSQNSTLTRTVSCSGTASALVIRDLRPPTPSHLTVASHPHHSPSPEFDNLMQSLELNWVNGGWEEIKQLWAKFDVNGARTSTVS